MAVPEDIVQNWEAFMSYREERPAPSLADAVECFWTDEAAPSDLRVLPDGCADVIFDLDRERVFVVGTMTRPLIVDAASRSRLFGVRFRPARISALLRLPLEELTDAAVPLKDIERRLDLR